VKRDHQIGRILPVHPYAWLWEPLEHEASFVLRAMFGTKVVYLDGKLMLCFAAKTEPWRGVLVCTDRVHHASLIATIPQLSPHAILPKWLYVAEAHNEFEQVAQRLVDLVRRRDSRIGVAAQSKTRKKTSSARTPKPRR
jgi:hypothetical protein